MGLILEDIDDRPVVTVFEISYATDDNCLRCGYKFDRGEEACFVSNELHHYECVEDDYRRRDA